MPKITISKEVLIASSVLGFALIISLTYILWPRHKPIEFTASVLEATATSTKLASATTSKKLKPVESEENVEKKTTVAAVAPPNNSTAASTNATYIVCMPIISTPASTVVATSSVQVLSAQSGKQLSQLPAQIQPVLNSLPSAQSLPQAPSNTMPAVGTIGPSNSSQTSSSGTNSGGSNQYQCAADTYNCSDFATQHEAQAVFESCGGVNNDVHRLDRDHNGQVCTSLPQ
jgi:hypothetical protein